MAPVNVLILGHSFVQRLNDYVQRCSVLKPFHDSTNLGMTADQICIHWKSVDGLMAHQLFDFVDFISVIKPQILYLEIGSHDLCAPSASPDKVAIQVLDFVTGLLNNSTFHFLKQVVIGLVVHRDLSSPNQLMTRSDYKAAIDRYNSVLHDVFDQDAKIMTWKHKGLLQDIRPDLLPDGMHLNERGLWKLEQSVKKSIAAAASKL